MTNVQRVLKLENLGKKITMNVYGESGGPVEDTNSIIDAECETYMFSDSLMEVPVNGQRSESREQTYCSKKHPPECGQGNPR